MTQANAPIDIGPKQIEKHKRGMDEMLEGYLYGDSKYRLSDLMAALDEDEPTHMNELEANVFNIIRESAQIFKEVVSHLSEKTQWDKIRFKHGQLTDPVFQQYSAFINGFAGYVASTYAANRLEFLVEKEEEKIDEDLSAHMPRLIVPSELFLSDILRPLYQALIPQHKAMKKRKDKPGDTSPLRFSGPEGFINYAITVFRINAERALEQRDKTKEFEKHLEGVQWRVMDDFITFEGYNVTNQQMAPRKGKKLDFTPVSPNEIAGNEEAKHEICRYVERMLLYDSREGKNPVLVLGGLPWTILFDGIPGTGKTTTFRMAMTILSELAERAGIPYEIIMIDQSVKDMYYGKTGQQLLTRLQPTHDPKTLSIVIADDIDLLTSSRADAQGADNDINNILMQYFDGALTVRRGNVLNFAASNDPTRLDRAIRNRFGYRLELKGPVTAEDMADMIVLLNKRHMERGILVADVGYTPFATQDIRKEDGTWTLTEEILPVESDLLPKKMPRSIHEVGVYLADLKKQVPSFSGRSVKAIVDNAHARAANWDVPREWLFDPKSYRDRPYAEKESMVISLYKNISINAIVQEAARIADSERRYTEAALIEDAERFARDIDVRQRGALIAVEKGILPKES